MKIKKILVIFISLLAATFIVSQTPEVKADLETSIQVSGTLYPSVVTPSEPNMKPQINQCIKYETKPSGIFGDLGDSNSNLITLCGILLLFSGIGLIVERLI
ncbi:hypothetical protein BW152_12400 [Lactococcus lactis]|uniref:hypothetical protein n=1 Tax=Lactococcus lactis TaxID=1358 RepID=UPI000BF912B0|nr:hypothetical protein [Lactococcus lactis]PFG75767.1 hypothetical protein BW152_12400 [Lactococcus lactis]